MTRHRRRALAASRKRYEADPDLAYAKRREVYAIAEQWAFDHGDGLPPVFMPGLAALLEPTHIQALGYEPGSTAAQMVAAGKQWWMDNGQPRWEAP